jgi:endoglucanase
VPTRIRVFLYAICLAVALPHCASEAAADQRALLLRYGLNLEGWLQTTAPGRHQLDDDAIQHIVRDGFDHVRVPVDPALIDKYGDAELRRLDQAIRIITSNGLAMIIDFHPSIKFPKEGDAFQGHVAWVKKVWTSIANHISRTDPGRVLIELYNEPGIDNDKWQSVAQELCVLLRSILPNHTFIVGGGNENTIYSLSTFVPIRDKKIIYSFHFYYPIRFTHQHASWMNRSYQGVPATPFPAKITPDLETFIKKLRLSGDVANALEIEQYCTSGISEVQIASNLTRAKDWSEKHNVQIILTEFGAINYAHTVDRVRWLGVVTTVSKTLGIAWTIWEHGSAFGVYNLDQSGSWVSDKEILRNIMPH